jgi:indolepyruvate ferredoxin oxidoreductase beta subunit
MQLTKDPFNIIITGVGGQGNVLASLVLGQVLVNQGYVVTIGETYGASQRGGAVMSHIRLSERDQFSPLIPEGACDLIIGLEPVETIRVLGHYGQPDVDVLVNMRPIHPLDVVAGDQDYPDLSDVLKKVQKLSRNVWTVKATDIALDMGDPIFANIIMLGALSNTGILSIDRDSTLNVIRNVLSAQKMDSNRDAFDRGKEDVKKNQVNPARPGATYV